MEDKVVGYVYKSYDYDKFRFMTENREVDHAAKIKKSTEKNGQLFNPILVNDRFEIIDGQNRFTAWRELGLPILYIIAESYGVDECRSLNSDAVNWKVKNYIGSYAAQGNEQYVGLKALEEKYKGVLPVMLIRSVASGNARTGGKGERYKSGGFKFGVTYQEAVDVLDFVAGFKMPKTLRGKANLLYTVFVFCYYSDMINKAKLIRQWDNYSGILTGITDIRSAAAAVETVYNYKCAQSNHVYIEAEYRKWSSQRCCAKPGGGKKLFGIWSEFE